MTLPVDKQQRKERPVARGCLDYFPDALAEVANLSYIGNQQHNPGEEMHWARGKSDDHADCVIRHLMERGRVDHDGIRHIVKVAWRALALAQIEIEQVNQELAAGEEQRKQMFPDSCPECGSDNVQHEPSGAASGCPDCHWGDLYNANPAAHEYAGWNNYTATYNASQSQDDDPDQVCAYCGSTEDDHDPHCPYCMPHFQGLPPIDPVGAGVKEFWDYLHRLTDWHMRHRQRQPLDNGQPVRYTYPAGNCSTDFNMVETSGNYLPGRDLTRGERYMIQHRIINEGCAPSVAANIAAGMTMPDKPNGKVVYVAGPMRGYKDFNFPSFDEARNRLVQQGYAVISPADIDRHAGGPDEDEYGPDMARSLAYRDFQALHSLSGENGDCVALLPRWELSTGAAAEFHLARWLQLKAIDAFTGERIA